MLEMNTRMHTVKINHSVHAFCLYFFLLPIIAMIMNSNRLFNSEFKYEF